MGGKGRRRWRRGDEIGGKWGESGGDRMVERERGEFVEEN